MAWRTFPVRATGTSTGRFGEGFEAAFHALVFPPALPLFFLFSSKPVSGHVLARGVSAQLGGQKTSKPQKPPTAQIWFGIQASQAKHATHKLHRAR